MQSSDETHKVSAADEGSEVREKRGSELVSQDNSILYLLMVTKERGWGRRRVGVSSWTIESLFSRAGL